MQDSDDPTCAICTDVLGTWGGPASLACGHNGCLNCLQKVQKHSSSPSCPLCRTPFNTDQSLCLNADLSNALDRAQVLEVIVRNAEAEHERLTAAVLAQRTLAEQNRKFFFYDVPLPEETGPWIPVSVPPIGERVHMGDETEDNDNGGFFPEDCMWLQEKNGNSELTLWSILCEIVAVACGSWKQKGSSQLSVTENFKEEGVSMDDWKDAFDPYASSLPDEMENHVRRMRAVLVAEPPHWMPDSSTSACMQCHLRFHPIMFPRHHCRLCGGLFCGSCSAGRSLLPIKFRERTPQRVCDSCWEKLGPVQGILFEQVSHAAQSATHDVTDLSCMRSWLNSPLGISMEHEIYKATNTLRNYLEVSQGAGYL